VITLPAPPSERSRSFRVRKSILFTAALTIILSVGSILDLRKIFLNSILVVENAGAAGPLILLALYVIACVFMLPSWFLAIGAGSIYGILNGSLIVSVSTAAGASAAFLTGRYLAREKIARRFGRNETFRVIDEAVASEGWKIVFLTRLSPAFPFNIVNYIYGFSGISFRHYFLASWAGMIPGTVMYVYIGALASDLASLGEENRVRTSLQWAMTAAGFAATLAVTALITRIARKALKRRLSQPPQTEENSRTQ